VRWQAAENLWLISEIATPAIPALIDALKDVNKNVRWVVAQALGRFGKAAVPAVPALIDTLKDVDEDVRNGAEQALERIGTPEALEALHRFWRRG
jgi:HEAT repeat protein